MKLFYKSCFIFLAIIISGCGYRLGHLSKDEHSVTVPYIKNDYDGFLTDELIKTVAHSGVFEYTENQNACKLKVEIVEIADEQIGYRRDRKNDGSLKKRISPVEGRRNVVVEASLVLPSGEILIGPYRITDYADYDYINQDLLDDLSFVNSLGTTQMVLPFSLGQLEPVSSAQDAALKPVYRRLAKKIVDLISANW